MSCGERDELRVRARERERSERGRGNVLWNVLSPTCASATSCDVRSQPSEQCTSVASPPATHCATNAPPRSTTRTCWSHPERAASTPKSAAAPAPNGASASPPLGPPAAAAAAAAPASAPAAATAASVGAEQRRGVGGRARRALGAVVRALGETAAREAAEPLVGRLGEREQRGPEPPRTGARPRPRAGSRRPRARGRARARPTPRGARVVRRAHLVDVAEGEGGDLSASPRERGRPAHTPVDVADAEEVELRAPAVVRVVARALEALALERVRRRVEPRPRVDDAQHAARARDAERLVLRAARRAAAAARAGGRVVERRALDARSRRSPSPPARGGRRARRRARRRAARRRG